MFIRILFFTFTACSILQKALETANSLKLKSEKEGIQDRLKNMKSLSPSTKEENRCHSERAKELSRNEAVEHDLSSIEDYLMLLENYVTELKEDECPVEIK